jgi:hypothetical protein
MMALRAAELFGEGFAEFSLLAADFDVLEG